MVVGPINLPVGRLFVEEVITECRKRGASRVDVLAFEFEMGLFPAVLDEAKQKGIDLAPKTIPPEVFDKRAVEKGQVRFHDVAYIEVTPRFDKKNKLAVAVELTDFSVYYSQGIADVDRRRLERRQERGRLRAGQAHQVEQRQAGHHHPRRADEAVDGLGGLLGGGFRLREPEGDHQGGEELGVEGALPGMADTGELLDFEERWTGAYIFENEWQSFRTRQSRDLELTSTFAHLREARPLHRRGEGDRYFRQRHDDARAGDGGVGEKACAHPVAQTFLRAVRLKTFAGVVQRTPLPRRDRRRKSIHRAYGLVRSSLGRVQRRACHPRKAQRHRRTTAHRHATHKIPAPPTRGRAGSVHSGPEILRPISRPGKRFANESKSGDRSCPGIVRISTIASQRSGTILILLPPWIVPMLNVGARSRVSGKLPPL